MKIHVIFTGGTIGSKASGGELDAAQSTSFQLLQMFSEKRPHCGAEFSAEILFSVLSEDFTISNWRQIYDSVKTHANDDCSGIIITHGTDTLAYSAAFLSFMLKETALPVLLVSGDYPLDDKRSNGLYNFIAAVDFITRVKTKGVFVPFRKNSNFTTIHLGVRLQQALPFVHSFSSLGDVPYGEIDDDGNFKWYANENNPAPEEIERPAFMVIPHFPDEKRIFYLPAYPGIDYDAFDFREKPDAVLHGLYHSGTACVRPEFERNSVIPFIKRCVSQKIDFYAAPFDSRLMMYRTSREMADAGAEFIGDVSFPAAYAKLLIAYGSFPDADARKIFLSNNIVCEQLFL